MIGALCAIDQSNADSRGYYPEFAASEYCSGRRRLMQHDTRPGFVQNMARVAVDAGRLHAGRRVSNATAYCVGTILDSSSGSLSTGLRSREICCRLFLVLASDVKKNVEACACDGNFHPVTHFGRTLVIGYLRARGSDTRKSVSTSRSDNPENRPFLLRRRPRRGMTRL